MKKPISIDAEELDRLFDEGGDISEYLGESRLYYGPKGSGHKFCRKLEVSLNPAISNRLEQMANDRGCAPEVLVERWVREKVKEPNTAI